MTSVFGVPGSIVSSVVREKKGTIKSIQTKFLWEIKDFLHVNSSGSVVESPPFNAHGFNFELTLWGNVKYGCEKNVRVEVHGLSSMSEPYPLVRISILNNKNSDDDFDCTLNRVNSYYKTDKLFNLKTVLSECVKDGTLCIVCTVTTGQCVPVDVSQNVPRKRLKLCMEAIGTFKKSFNKKELSDVVFCVEGKNIYAQKSILICKSPVFAAMFSGDNLENKTNKVDIVDSTYDAMYALLEYVYTGITQEHLNLDCATCLAVLVAAEKYNMEFLKGKFQEIICEKLTTNNVLECLITADSNDAAYLKQKIIDYIVFNSQNIIELRSFKELLLSHPELSCEIIKAMSSKIVIP